MEGFQTNVFHDGVWVTTTVSTQEALEASSKAENSRKPLHYHTNAPQCGVLTRTIVPSPVAHWILPIRIRSKARIDVAFVGSHAVQISELRSDGQLIDIIRKDDFGSRICNAVVMGDTPNTPQDIVAGDHTDLKIEDALRSPGSQLPGSDSKARVLSPQILVLFLENGQLAFLFVTGGAGTPWRFEMALQQTPGSIKNLGFRLAIDPSSRYLAAASSQKAFMVWELEDRAKLEEQYEKQGVFKPLKQTGGGGATRSFQGTLIHLEFLFPAPEHADSIYLMMVVARRDSFDGSVASRVVTFDWLAGEDVKSSMQGDSNGIRLPQHYKMPLMIIPLRFQQSVCVVSEQSIGVINNVVSGSMCEDLMTQRPPRTPLHHGLSEPLWAAWARPIRGDWYCKTTDIIMLAREDGYLIHIEVDAANVIPSVTSAGSLDSTISTAFAMPYIHNADAIIVSGDSSPGGTWKLSPRDDPVRASTLHNWAPAVDITKGPLSHPQGSMAITKNLQHEHDLLVTASGRGIKGNLASFRWGVKARIGCDIDTESTPHQIGAFMGHQDGSELLHVVLSLPDSAILLQFSSDLTQIRALHEGETSLDLTSRTLCIHYVSQQVLQVTENCICLIIGSQSYRHMLQAQGIIRAEHAACTEQEVVLTSHGDSGSKLHAYSIDPEGITSTADWQINGEVTYIHLASGITEHETIVVVGVLIDGHPWISVFELNGRLLVSEPITPEEAPTTQHAFAEDNALFETLTSIQTIALPDNLIGLVVGTVWGRILTLEVSLAKGSITATHIRKFGKSAVRLFPLTSDSSHQDMFVACDDNLVLLQEYSNASRKYRRETRVIATSDDDAASQVPPIHWVSVVPPELQIGSGFLPVLLLAGSRVLLAELSEAPSLVPRSLPIEGTPIKIIYSDIWQAYIVAVIRQGVPDILFVDATTGYITSQPTSNDGRPATFASGLGVPGDRIMCMDEWRYMKDGKTFPYILVGMQNGVLLTLSVRDADKKVAQRTQKRIEYWMRYKRRGKPDEPVYAVLGVDDGTIHCSGTTLYYEVIDAEKKKLQVVSRFELDSPAVVLQARDKKLYVLTSRHSLLILDYINTARGRVENQMILLHADTATRGAIHMTPMSVPTADDPDGTITMLSDASSNVVGAWTALGNKEQPLETVFKAALPVPIRRFIQARCRPPWYEKREEGRFGTVRSTKDDTDTFGLALNGALYHFTLLEAELLALLRFIEYRAKRTASFAAFANSKHSMEAEMDDTGFHIDGDLLARCLNDRALEQIMAPSDLRCNLFDMLDKIEGGALTDGFREDTRYGDRYFELAYRILEYLDTPVM